MSHLKGEGVPLPFGGVGEGGMLRGYFRVGVTLRYQKELVYLEGCMFKQVKVHKSGGKRGV